MDVSKSERLRLEPLPDGELIRLVRERDEAAFEALVRRYEDRVFRLAVRVLGDRDEARDVGQEVFIGIWENPGAYRPRAEFGTWLYRVVFNRALNRQRILRVKAFLSLSSLTSRDEPPVSTSDLPDRGLERDEKVSRLARELDRLPPRQRAALHLRYREGLSVDEVAAVLKVSRRAAEGLIFRGKQTLRERLKD